MIHDLSREEVSENKIAVTNLPDHWNIAKLREVFIFTKKPKELRYSAFEQIPFVPMDLVPIGSIFINRFVLKSQEELSSGTYFENGDILVAKITPSFENGKQGIIEELPTPFGVATTEVIPIKAIEGVSDKYFLFFYLLRPSVRTTLAGKMEGSTGRQRLSITTLVDLEIPFPSLSEQRAIAHVLRTTQEAIESRRQELELERERKAALMAYLFTHGTRGEPTKQAEIGEMPESWEVVRLGNVVQMKYGYQTSIPRTPPPNGTQIISTAEILNTGRLDLSKIRTVAIPDRLIEKYLVQRNDILFNWRNAQEHVGKTAIIDFDLKIPTIFASFIINLRVNEGVHHQFLHFLLTYLRNEGTFFKLSRRAVNQANFNANELGALNIPLPPLPEQLEIAGIILACDTKIAALEQEISLHEELFRALLEELMTGRLSTIPLIETE